MNIIGITGSSGAGKSTVCDILQEEYQVKVINADKIAKELSKRGTSYLDEIIEKFGKDILDENGELKRKKLAEIIYNNFEKRKLLNLCTFKYIKKEIKSKINRTKKENVTIIIDAPLLFECGLDEFCNLVVGVISQKDIQIERIVARDNIDYESAEKRIGAQEGNSFFKEKCDFIIENNNDIVNTKKMVSIIANKCNITKRLQ